ncbi:host attachment protein [Paraburkholderia fungorum]|jgi:protein required for attachment to host cells|uniref:Host attachment protein n=2 Tax=Paraburkholderia fungorum TaxID=134537 RepID=A0AAP1PMK9_9BURK|nr:host attachment protein [Paraburkholderia fungorum]MBB4516083.1 protein required for attachment to host cells [Paraburkholderia fungorum]MBB5541536.1 protein required for attachment to host cells [Paraburkholderia fungorum]MBB6204812.1 protein required for attachment to host cells [Paraburkholderia fungorum]MDT8842396.1 host attachment protein [Paraburkholderia fungorum]USU20364.1 host attachment protein [Paraburkholderia fungorum]
MMSDMTWLVVADGGRARVFQTPGLTLALQEKEDLINTAYTGTMLTEKDREKFAKRVSDYLEAGRLHQLYNRLRLAIEPKFLGMVKANLSEDTRRLIFEQVSEDLSTLNARQIEAHLGRKH